MPMKKKACIVDIKKIPEKILKITILDGDVIKLLILSNLMAF
jgi:hypothetical protein